MRSNTFLLVAGLCSALRSASSLRGSRDLQSNYFSTSDSAVLGQPNEMASLGNPMTGLLTSPRWNQNPAQNLPSSIDFYYIGLDEVMKGPSDFDWTPLEDMIASSALHGKHIIPRFFCDWPGRPELRLPQYLFDAGLQIVKIDDTHYSPVYDDPLLLEALEQFIVAFGASFDGNPGIAAIQVGLLGFWGEWHTYGTDNLLSQDTKNKVAMWYENAFSVTMLQIRDPATTADYPSLGLHDDSFAYTTIDGEYNGGVEKGFYFWSKVEEAGRTNFWKTAMMGGEIRPELQLSIFTDSYPAGTERNQDFETCVDITHASYMIHAKAFVGDGFSGTTLERALRASAHMGYGFEVTNISAASTGIDVKVDVSVKQTGVAPFYYPLALALTCDGAYKVVPGVEHLIENGDVGVFSFSEIPADSTCLDNVQISLESDHLLSSRPMKFSQGTGTVSLSLPLPPSGPVSTGSPIMPPTSEPPTMAPVDTPTTSEPSVAPTTSEPSVAPVDTPVSLAPNTGSPTSSPEEPPSTRSPTSAPIDTPTTDTPSTGSPTATPVEWPTSYAPTPPPTKRPKGNDKPSSNNGGRGPPSSRGNALADLENLATDTTEHTSNDQQHSGIWALLRWLIDLLSRIRALVRV